MPTVNSITCRTLTAIFSQCNAWYSWEFYRKSVFVSQPVPVLQQKHHHVKLSCLKTSCHAGPACVYCLLSSIAFLHSINVYRVYNAVGGAHVSIQG